MNEKPNYTPVYVPCICPNCQKKITLKIYAKPPALMEDFAELCGEEE